MRLGLIGVGTVGGTLKKYFEENTNHILRCYDPGKGLSDSLYGCEAIFISVPVRPSSSGQDTFLLELSCEMAKKYTPNVFVRSTVLPGTCDRLGATSMPEFLTERRAYEDMCNLPVLVGPCDKTLLRRIFPDKEFVCVSNVEAELAKFAHNCFGAVKVTYFNLIYNLAKEVGADFEQVKRAAGITGFIEPTHTQVPGPDGMLGFGGKCFPENIEAIKGFYHESDIENSFFKIIQLMNVQYRMNEKSFYSEQMSEAAT